MAEIVFCRINRHSPSTVNKTWFPFQVNRILSFLVSILLLSCSPPFFYAVNYSYSIWLNQYPFSISMIVLHYLSIDQWIHKCGQWSNINPFEPFHCVTIKFILPHYPKQPVCYQYWTNPYSNHHLIMIGRLESLSFVNAQFVMVGSLVITMMMIIEMNGWLIETTILIQCHCKNGKENSIIRQVDKYFDNNGIMNCDQESVWNKLTNTQSIEMF